jgi:hypothetical protein
MAEKHGVLLFQNTMRNNETSFALASRDGKEWERNDDRERKNLQIEPRKSERR